MHRRRIGLLSVSIICVALLGAVSISGVYAYAAYYGNWPEQPYYGNHWWYNNGQLVWDTDDYWTTARLQSMQSGHNNLPYKEYRLEQEAYNPGSGTHCDRLVIASVDTMDLPVTSFSSSNGCGSSSYSEELKLELNENAVTANTWLRHRVTYNKRNPGSGGDGEVNYSFSHNWATGDSWMGKITYDQNFNKLGSDPSGMVN